MKTHLVAPLILLTLGSIAQAQVQGPATSLSPGFGFALPTVEGTLTYALTGSESVATGAGYGNTVASETTLSGDVAYLSSSQTKPFSLVYSGGYLYSNVPGYPGSSTFQNLALSQVVVTKNWNFVVDDAVSYLPQSPITGFSGIPGVGDIGVTPVQIGDQPAQSILTNYGVSVSNGLNGGVTRQITGSTSITGSASWQLLRFFNNLGIDSTGEYATLGLNHRINARSSVGASATYSYTSEQYQNINLPFTTEGLMFQYQRQWSRTLSMSIAAGPQRTYGTGASELFMPAQIDFVANAGVTYTRRLTSASLTYSRATNGGSGVIYGALTDSVSLSAHRQLSRNWQAAVTGSYFRSVALAQVPGFNESYQGADGSIQVSRKISRSLSAYASYTAITQSAITPGASQNVFSGLGQVFAAGLTYSPGAIHPGHF
jgi:hypothetical protein